MMLKEQPWSVMPSSHLVSVNVIQNIYNTEIRCVIKKTFSGDG